MDTDRIRSELDSFAKEFGDLGNHRGNITKDMHSKLFTAFSVLCNIVFELTDEIDNMKKDSFEAKRSYAQVVSDTDMLKRDKAKTTVCKDLEEADRTAKVMDLGISCKANELKDMHTVIRAKLHEDVELNNWLLDSSITPIFTSGKPDPKSPDQSYSVGTLIRCKSADHKKNLLEAIATKHPTWKTPYHFPSKLIPSIRKIRNDFSNLETTLFDPKSAHLLIRPNRSFSGLILKYRKAIGDKWVHLGNIDINIDAADSGSKYLGDHKKIFDSLCRPPVIENSQKDNSNSD